MDNICGIESNSEIVTSRVSVYEIELDLSQWKYTATSEVPSFHDDISRYLKTIKNHKCMSGKPGGFLEEVKEGTDFAHVIEHVLLELLHLADDKDRSYTGWTNSLGKNRYVIHYSAPDFLTGRLAAILGLDLVKRIIRKEKVNTEHYINLLKNPRRYFTREGELPEISPDKTEPFSVIKDMDQEVESDYGSMDIEKLDSTGIENIKSALKSIEKDIDYVVYLWRNAFLEYSGKFGQSIINKVELINIDKYFDILLSGDFESYFRGVKNISTVLNAYRIPIHFVQHSVWIYKSHLFGFIIQEQEGNGEERQETIFALEDFFKMVTSNVSAGFASSRQQDALRQQKELKEFREPRTLRSDILVVDDDSTSRVMLGDILRFHGYNSIPAESGAKALKILEKQSANINIVILDMLMPGMSGKEVYNEIRGRFPHLKVLISSGYADDSDIAEISHNNDLRLIKKPFKMEDLMQNIRAMEKELQK